MPTFDNFLDPPILCFEYVNKYLLSYILNYHLSLCMAKYESIYLI